MTDQENPLKASRPIPPPPSDGELVAFNLTVHVDIKGMTMRTEWGIGDADAQAAFFEQHPLAAAMLLAVARGPVAPPMVRPQEKRPLQLLGDPEE